jgi:hypothetical protein
MTQQSGRSKNDADGASTTSVLGKIREDELRPRTGRQGEYDLQATMMETKS